VSSGFTADRGRCCSLRKCSDSLSRASRASRRQLQPRSRFIKSPIRNVAGMKQLCRKPSAWKRRLPRRFFSLLVVQADRRCGSSHAHESRRHYTWELFNATCKITGHIAAASVSDCLCACLPASQRHRCTAQHQADHAKRQREYDNRQLAKCKVYHLAAALSAAKLHTPASVYVRSCCSMHCQC
jgi:hypothetical protein